MSPILKTRQGLPKAQMLNHATAQHHPNRVGCVPEENLLADTARILMYWLSLSYLSWMFDSNQTALPAQA